MGDSSAIAHTLSPHGVGDDRFAARLFRPGRSSPSHRSACGRSTRRRGEGPVAWVECGCSWLQLAGPGTWARCCPSCRRWCGGATRCCWSCRLRWPGPLAGPASRTCSAKTRRRPSSGPLWERFAVADPAEQAVLANRELFARLCTTAMLPTLEGAFAWFRPDLVVREPCEYASAVVAEQRGVRHVQVAIGLAEVERASLEVAAPARHRRVVPKPDGARRHRHRRRHRAALPVRCRRPAQRMNPGPVAQAAKEQPGVGADGPRRAC